MPARHGLIHMVMEGDRNRWKTQRQKALCRRAEDFKGLEICESLLDGPPRETTRTSSVQSPRRSDFAFI
jgi:hypothetical protein